MNDAYTAHVPTLTLIEKIIQQPTGRIHGLAVEIEFRHHAEFTPPQTPQGPAVEAGARPGQRLTEFGAQLGAVTLALGEFPQHRAVVGAALAGDGRWTPRAEVRRVTPLERPDILHGGTEKRGIRIMIFHGCLPQRLWIGIVHGRKRKEKRAFHENSGQ
jgi:hypothetical protein